MSNTSNRKLLEVQPRTCLHCKKVHLPGDTVYTLRAASAYAVCVGCFRRGNIGFATRWPEECWHSLRALRTLQNPLPREDEYIARTLPGGVAHDRRERPVQAKEMPYAERPTQP